jgi:hypothetical protein
MAKQQQAKQGKQLNENLIRDIGNSLNNAFHLSLLFFRTAEKGLFYSKEEIAAAFDAVNTGIYEADDAFSNLFPEEGKSA